MSGVFRPLRVWSRNQRIIHWVVAGTVLLLIPLGALIFSADFLGLPEAGEDAVIDLHGAIGVVFAIGAASRLLYLFIGPPESLWRDTIPHTKAQWALGAATVKYYLSGFKGKAPLYYSHNPLAGIYDSVLFLAMTTQAISGIAMFLLHVEGVASVALANGLGTSAHDEAHGPEWLLVVHVIGAVVIIGFVVSHFAALALHDIFERRGLVSSMISGNKFFDEDEIKELGRRNPEP